MCKCNVFGLQSQRVRLFVLQVGERVRLVCNFSLGTDQLYSVKWYKDNMEFYR